MIGSTTPTSLLMDRDGPPGVSPVRAVRDAHDSADLGTVVDVEVRHGQAMFGFVRRLGLGDEQAQDCVQEGMLRLWAEPGRGTRVEDPKAWPYRRLMVAEPDDRRIAIFRTDGTFVEYWTSVGAGTLAAGPGGNITVGDWSVARILGPDGSVITALPQANGTYLTWFAVLPDGRILGVEWSHDPASDDEHVRIYRLR